MWHKGCHSRNEKCSKSDLHGAVSAKESSSKQKIGGEIKRFVGTSCFSSIIDVCDPKIERPPRIGQTESSSMFYALYDLFCTCCAAPLSTHYSLFHVSAGTRNTEPERTMLMSNLMSYHTVAAGTTAMFW
jgi:hypothetical protein